MQIDRPELSSRFAEEFGKTIRMFREKSGMTQDELAFTSKIDRSYVSQIERGLKNVTVPVIWALASALGKKPHVLMKALEERLESFEAQDD